MNENMNLLAVVEVTVRKVFSVSIIKILFYYLFVNFNLNII